MSWSAILAREFIPVFGFIILFLFVKANNKMSSDDRKLFYCVIATGIAELIVFEAELWTAAFAEPSFLRILLSVIGYTLRPLLVYQLIMISYRSQSVLTYRLVLVSDRKLPTVSRKILLLIPCVLCFLCVSTAFFSQVAFWYDEANQFHRGLFGYVPHIICAFYFVLFACVTCRYARKQRRIDGLISVSISSFAICALLVDTFISAGGVTRIGIMLCTFFAYVQTQNRALFPMIDNLRMRNHEISLLMKQIGKIVCIYDVPTRTLTMTEQYAKLRGYSNNMVIAPDETCANNLVSDEYRQQYLEFYNRIFAGEPSGNIIAKFIVADGTERWEETDFITIFDENGQPKRAIISIEDITESYEMQTDLIARANYDTLTGVLTRDATMEEIETYLSGEGKKGTHALIMMDMDNLKSINDNLGHQFGDDALKNFAGQVREFFPQENIVGRIGGDEFFVFVKNAVADELPDKMGELLHKLERTYTDKGKQVKITGSAGLAMYYGDKPPVKTLNSLYTQADKALYKAKALGKNTFSISEEA